MVSKTKNWEEVCLFYHLKGELKCVEANACYNENISLPA